MSYCLVCISAKHSHHPSSCTSSIPARRVWEQPIISGPPPTRPAWLNVSSNPATRFQGLVTAYSHFHFWANLASCYAVWPRGREDPNRGRRCRGLRGWRVPPVSHQTLHLVLGSPPSRDPSFQTNHTTICLSALRPAATIPVDTWLGAFRLFPEPPLPHKKKKQNKKKTQSNNPCKTGWQGLQR